MLRDLRIQNYRCFEDFYIDGLAPVNLIVGKNNIGKTSLLEAIYLLESNFNSLGKLIHILARRNEKNEKIIFGDSGEIKRKEVKYPFRFLFSNQDAIARNDEVKKLTIEAKQNEQIESFEFSIEYTTSDKVIPPMPELRTPPFPSIPYYEFPQSHSDRDRQNNTSVFLLTVTDKGYLDRTVRLDDGDIDSPSYHLYDENTKFDILHNNSQCILLDRPLNFGQLSSFWNSITLTAKEDKIIEFLRILEPKIDRISFTNIENSRGDILLKISDRLSPIPLGSMGGGIKYILTISMLAVTLENGYLLIDEIDTGLHYETQAKMWKLLMEVAKQLNIQIFATTHSWDCIEAFQEAMEELEDESIGKLFRISNKYGKLRPVEYISDEIAAAVRQGIEVR